MSKRIKVFIVDDHLIVREGITYILEIEKDIEVVGQASNAQETLSQISKLVPDIVLMDLKMPGVDGIQLTRLVKDKLPTCKVIILTLYDQYVDEAMEAGANGYLLKDITLEDLVDSIKRVYGGAKVFGKNIRPVIKIDYEEKAEGEDKDLPDAAAKESPGDIPGTLYNQVKLFILPRANIGDALRLTSVVEEALSGDFKQVEGTPLDGISITFNLNTPLIAGDINRRLSKISHVKTLNHETLAGSNDSLKIIEEKQKFEIKHPSVKTIFIQLYPQG